MGLSELGKNEVVNIEYRKLKNKQNNKYNMDKKKTFNKYKEEWGFYCKFEI